VCFSLAFPLSKLRACFFRFTLQRYEDFPAPPNFNLRFGAVLMKNSSKLLTLGKAHAGHGFALA
jgi:hypothetical protein